MTLSCLLLYTVKFKRKLFKVVLGGYSYFVLRMNGVQVGENVHLGYPPIIVRNKNASIVIGDHVTLAASPMQNPACLSKTLVIAAHSSGAEIRIGEHSGISCSVINASRSIQIGKYVNIGADCAIYDTDFHPLDMEARRAHDVSKINSSPVVIHDDVWLGARVTVLKGVTIGKGSIVAAGAVVTKDIPPFSLAAGVPAKVVRQLNCDDREENE